jgi:large subunit ribosomal protein L20
MPRATNNPASRARRKRIMKAARGFFGARSKVYTVAKNTVEKGWQYAFRDRKFKKRVYRRLWIARINAAVRPEGLSYSRFIHALATQGIGLNRKALADLALNNPTTFKAIVDVVRSKAQKA